MNNPFKVVFGSLVGAGIGAAISKAIERGNPDYQETAQFSAIPGAPKPSFIESVKDRLARAQEAGEAARIAKEDELRAYFREKVNDPEAMRHNPTP